MSRSAGLRNKGSDTLIILTTARDDDEAPAPERVSRPQSSSSRRTVFKIMQQSPPPLPRSPPPQQIDDQNEMSVSMSLSLEEVGGDAGAASTVSAASPMVRIIPRGGSIMLEQVAEIGSRPSSSVRKHSPPRRKSVPAALPPRRQERSRSLSRASGSSRAATPTIIHVVQESVMENEPEPVREPEPDSEDADIKVKFEIKTVSSSSSSSSSSSDAPSPPKPAPEPCLDCLEEFVRRKRAEKQRAQPKKSSSMTKVTMSKRICSSRRSPSSSSRRSSSNVTSAKGGARCPKCFTCKSCGSISVTIP